MNAITLKNISSNKIRRILILGLSMILFCQCNTDKGYEVLKDKISGIDISTKDFFTSYGFYALSNTILPSEKEVDSLANVLLPGYKKYEIRNIRRDEPGYYVETIHHLQGALRPPTHEYLKMYGSSLSKHEREQLLKSESVLAITFYGGKDNINVEQKRIHKFISELSANKNYVIADFVTLQYFNSESWNTARLIHYENDVSNSADQILIKISKADNGMCRAVTFGMEKFCLPDLSIPEFSCEASKKYSDLLLLVGQYLSENRRISSDSTLQVQLSKFKNPKWKVLAKKLNALNDFKIRFKRTSLQIGDKNNVQYEISSRDLKSMVDSIFGVSNTLQYVLHDDQIKNISAEARKELPKLKIAFNTNKLVDDYLVVKAPILTGSSSKEWMWVKVIRWDQNVLEGSLYNTASNNAYLKEGVVVSVDEKDIFDFIIKNQKGELIGNETEKYLLSQKSKGVY
ncbi:DUF2314 domain-containing protein [Aquimarina sp. D1M17]|uniref:DUF2314 domain-containing protein n=1 Tax=Aquimarina acroporae TaxID=2937283 RepID=UPI0020BF0220|nr:DUF2314 domain-containing protein [Aquimarina acroporae]MCK8523180.1 DUF2314 domain-containing protein [Aquimarina acroporae]